MFRYNTSTLIKGMAGGATSTTFHNNYFTQHDEVLCSSTSFATSPQIPASAISRRAGDQKLIIDLVWPYGRYRVPSRQYEINDVVVVKWGPPGFGAPHPQITRDLGLGGPHTTRVMGTP